MKYTVLFSLLFIFPINGMNHGKKEHPLFDSDSEFELLKLKSDEKDIRSGDTKSKLLETVKKPTLDITESILTLMKELAETKEQLSNLTSKIVDQDALMKAQNQMIMLAETKAKAAELKAKAAEEKAKTTEDKIKVAEDRAKQTAHQLDALQFTLNTGMAVGGGFMVIGAIACCKKGK